jgi:glycine/D-amino acid oxidase-like deaminating enzyme
MKRGSGTTASVWMKTIEIPSRPALATDISADICVVGAGIAGLTTAYLLAEEGRSVVVVDEGPIAGGETSRTTAHLVNALDDRYFDIESMHGAKGAQLAAANHTAAIDRIESIISTEKSSVTSRGWMVSFSCLRGSRLKCSTRNWPRRIARDLRASSASAAPR